MANGSGKLLCDVLARGTTVYIRPVRKEGFDVREYFTFMGFYSKHVKNVLSPSCLRYRDSISLLENNKDMLFSCAIEDVIVRLYKLCDR